MANDNSNDPDPINRATSKYEHHPSILKIKEIFGNKGKFSFVHCKYEDVCDEIRSLNISKACPKTSIPTNIIKENCDIFALKLHNDLNHSIDDATFPNNLKQADVTPAHNKEVRTDEINYRPVRILPAISKIYERILLIYQVDTFMDKKLSKHQCGFRNGYSAQHCLPVMLEKWRAVVDKGAGGGGGGLRGSLNGFIKGI